MIEQLKLYYICVYDCVGRGGCCDVNATWVCVCLHVCCESYLHLITNGSNSVAHKSWVHIFKKENSILDPQSPPVIMLISIWVPTNAMIILCHAYT